MCTAEVVIGINTIVVAALAAIQAMVTAQKRSATKATQKRKETMRESLNRTR